MVFSLPSNLDQAQLAMRIPRRRSQHFQKIRLANMVRTRARHQCSARPQHLKSPQIDLLISAQRSVQVALRFGESWRVENDAVITLARSGVVLEQIEGVGLD